MPLQYIIPSYLYSDFSDDEDLTAFVSAFNQLAQKYADFFYYLNLPIYPTKTGALLDWVGQGIYGMPRPYLPADRGRDLGPIDTIVLGSFPIDLYKKIGLENYYLVNDDIYIRVLTWHFFKGDGKFFTIEWLKRRIARFLFGPDFDVAVLYGISVTFSGDNQVNINLIHNIVTVVKPGYIGGSPLDSMAIDTQVITSIPFSIPPLAPVLKGAIDSGVLELPFQYEFFINI